MNKGKQIKAIAMLLIMLTMMTHNVFPHIHHEHTSNRITITSSDLHHDHHDHDHHDHDQGHEHKSDGQSEESEKTNLLDFLFEGHLHASHTHQYTTAPAVDFREFNLLVLVTNYFQSTEIYQIDFGERSEESNKYSDFQQHYSSNVCLCSNPLRGPPTLG